MLGRVIETERLILRTFCDSDSHSCYENYGQDKELGRFLPMYPLRDEDAMGEMVHNYVNAAKDGAFIWVITCKETGECIGNVTVDVPYTMLGVGEIGYLIGSKYWHHGYAGEAVHAVVRYMFEKEQLHLIEAKYNEYNVASGKLLSKMGFVEEGRLRDRRIDTATGERNALVVCSVVEKEVK